jgi:tetratricopeptide (TPR) repeat protein
MRSARTRAIAVISAAVVWTAIGIAPVAAQVIVAGSSVTPETDLSAEQEQRLLGEYWTVAKQYKLEPKRAVTAMAAWTRDRIGKAQSIQYQPENTKRPDYLESKAEWSPATLRIAAMLHSDVGLEAFSKGNLQEFEFQIAIADGWFALADNRQSAPGSLRSRWNVTIARLLLATGEIGMAERHLQRINDRISGDLAILLAYATVKETQASRILAPISGGRIEEPAVARKPRASAITAAIALFEKAIALEPGLVEARVRLAHSHILKGDDAKADEMLTALAARRLPPATKYLVLSMTGGIRERQSQLDAAARLYVDAILQVQDGQSAYFSLAHVMLRAGQQFDAATVLERLFGRAIVDLSADPWWTYALGSDLNFDARFEEYRADVRR